MFNSIKKRLITFLELKFVKIAEIFITLIFTFFTKILKIIEFYFHQI